MHETSLVRTLLEQVQQICRERHVEGLRSVRISIGAFSGVEPVLVRTAFEECQTTFFPYPVALQIDSVPLTGCCRTCNTEFEISDFRFVCPVCHKDDVKIISGDELRIVSLEGTIDQDKVPASDRLAPHSLTGRF